MRGPVFAPAAGGGRGLRRGPGGHGRWPPSALILAGDRAHDFTFCQWFGAGEFSTAMNVHYDPLAAVMALMVTFVAGIIHLYSVAFMRDDDDYVRYFCYLNLFVFAMLVITVADNLHLRLPGLGRGGLLLLCPHRLLVPGRGQRQRRPQGLHLHPHRRRRLRRGPGPVFCPISTTFPSPISTPMPPSSAPAWSPLLALLLLWAAVGKSAQLPLTVWLPDAMAGPTPVSALIHAATMVTAGAYLLMRLFPVVQLSPTAMLVIAGVGAVTTLYAALAALAQWDIKRMLAYSTISQVGYMFLAVGAGDIVGGIFHLVSHAFFKALLFLAAGCVIQALDEEHNIFRMGNLRRRLPAVYWLFLAGAVSLSAFPAAGRLFQQGPHPAGHLYPSRRRLTRFSGCWPLVAAFLTPLYTFRVFFVAFPERPDGRRPEEIHPTPRFMAWVLWPLAVLRPGRRPAKPARAATARTFWATTWPCVPGSPAGPGGRRGHGVGHGHRQRRPSWWLPSSWPIVSIAAGRSWEPALAGCWGLLFSRLLPGPPLSAALRPALSGRGPVPVAAGR